MCVSLYSTCVCEFVHVCACVCSYCDCIGAGVMHSLITHSREQAMSVAKMLAQLSRVQVSPDGSCWLWAPLHALGVIDHPSMSGSLPTKHDRRLDKVVRQHLWDKFGGR